jgi:hypothetical protein
MSTRPIDVVRERKVHGASPADLLAVGLAREPEATELILPECRRLLAKYGSMHRLGDLPPDDLRQAAGLENFEIERLTLILLEQDFPMRLLVPQKRAHEHLLELLELFLR